MEYTVPQYALMLVAFAIYVIKPRWLLLLWLISTPLLGPFVVLFSGVTDFVEQQQIVWNLWGVFNRVYLLAIVIEIVKGKKFYKSISPILPAVIILVFYIAIHNLITHFYPSAIIREIISIVYTLVPLFILLLNKEMWPSLKELYIVAFIICVVQLIFIPLNLQGIFAYSGRYFEMIQGGVQSHLMPGSFTRSNMMGDYLSVIYLFVTIDYFSRKSISFINYLIFSVIVLIPMFYAGSKVTIVCTVINILLCIAIFNRKNFAIVGFSFILFFGIISFLGSNRNDDISSNEGLNRVIGEMSELVQTKKKSGSQDESTLQYSTDLIDRYFWSSPIIGHGNAYEEDENAYYSTLDTEGLKTDATLAFYLVEYGIIGLFLFLMFQYQVVRFASFPVPLSQRKSIALIIFLFFFLMAFTERGLFDKSYFIFTFTYLFGLARFYNEEENKSLNLKNKS